MIKEIIRPFMSDMWTMITESFFTPFFAIIIPCLFLGYKVSDDMALIGIMIGCCHQFIMNKLNKIEKKNDK